MLDRASEDELSGLELELERLEDTPTLLMSGVLLGTKLLDTEAIELTVAMLDALGKLLAAVIVELDDVLTPPPVHALTTKAKALIAEIFFIMATALILACNKLPLHSWQS